jgi:hypothetical protein
MEGPVMAFYRVNIDEELAKAAKGKKTKLPVEFVLYNALRDYPTIQALIADAFSITEWC